jgi:hypothetical protein
MERVIGTLQGNKKGVSRAKRQGGWETVTLLPLSPERLPGGGWSLLFGLGSLISYSLPSASRSQLCGPFHWKARWVGPPGQPSSHALGHSPPPGVRGVLRTKELPGKQAQSQPVADRIGASCSGDPWPRRKLRIQAVSATRGTFGTDHCFVRAQWRQVPGPWGPVILLRPCPAQPLHPPHHRLVPSPEREAALLAAVA